MSRSIDERVVSMRFDNKQFEAAAATSMSTLDKLKSKLDFRGASKGLNEIAKAADTVSLDGLTKSASAVEVKFSAMSVAAIASINRVVNAAIDAGSRIAKSLTIDPINTGFAEYELKMNSVQTIMASTGADLQTVTGYLEELNEYADKTIYSFADMTQNIGKFTNAGVKLEDAVKAIQGISNEAAVSGANANEASRAMYNFAQALSAGYVKLIDWKSIELANMATVEFKTQLLETAAALGTVSKASDGTYRTLEGDVLSATKNFNETLEQQWLTTDVLIETLGNYADETTEIGKKAFAAAQDVKTFSQLLDTLKEAAGSGWATTWEIVIGNFEEAKEIWTTASEVIGGMLGKAADERNAMLRDWKALGGRDSMLRTFGNAWKALLAVITPVRDAIRDVFPPTTGQQLAAMTAAVEKFTKSLILSEEASYTLKVAMKALLIPLNVLVQLARVGASALATLTTFVFRLADSFLALPSKTDMVTKALRNLFGDSRYERAANAVSKITERVGNVFVTLLEKVLAVGNAVRGSTMSSLFSVFEKFADILEPIGGWILDRIVDGLEKVADFDFSVLIRFGKDGVQYVTDKLKAFWNLLSPITSAVSNFFTTFKMEIPTGGLSTVSEYLTRVKDSIVTFNITSGFKSALDILKSGFEAVGDSLGGFISGLKTVAAKLDPVKLMVFAFGIAMTGVALSTARAISSMAGVFDSVTGTLNGFNGVLSAIQKRILPSRFQQIALAVGALAAALVVLSLIDAGKVKQATISILTLMGALVAMTAAIAAIDRFLAKSDDFGQHMQEMGTGLALMSAAIAGLSVSVAILSSLDLTGFMQGLGGIIILMGTITAYSVAMAKFAPTLSKNSLFLVAFAASITMVVNSLAKLAKADLNGVVDNIGSLTVMMGMLLGVATIASKIKLGSAAGVGLLAINLLLFVKVLQILGKIDVGSVAAGIGPLIPIMGLIVLLSKATESAAKSSLKAAGSVVLMSGAIMVLVEAIKAIAKIDPNDATKGILVISALFAVFSLISRSMKTLERGQKTASLGKEILVMSAAILALSLVIKYIGGMELGEVIKGTAAVTALLGMFAIIGKVGKSAKGSIGYIASVTAAIGIMTAAMTILTLIPAKDLLKSVAAISAMLLSFSAAMKIMADMNTSKPLSSAIKMATLLTAVSAAFWIISKMDADKALPIAVALSSVLISVSAATKLITKTDWGSAKASALELGALLAASVAAVGVLTLFDSTGILEKAGALSAILIAVSSATAILNKFPTGSLTGSIKTIATMVGIITAVGVMVFALGQLSKIDGFNEVISDGTRLFGELGRAIGSFVGNVIGGLVGGVIGGTAITAAESLTIFSEKIKPFIDDVRDIDNSAVTGAGNLAKVLLAVTGASVIDGIAGLLGLKSDLEEVGEDLESFAPGVKNFIEEISSIGGDSIAYAVDAVNAVSELLNAIPRIGGLVQSITGVVNIEHFASDMDELGDGVRKFSNAISGIDVDATTIDAARNIGEALSGLLNSLPETGGAMQAWFGQKSFSVLTAIGDSGKTAIEEFADALVGYSDIISSGNIDAKVVTNSTNAAKALSELANSLPPTGGVLQQWFGEKDLSGFSDNILKLAEALVDYCEEVSSDKFSLSAVTTSISAIRMIADILTELPKTGVLQKFTGEKDLDEFSKQIQHLGTVMEDFGNKVTDLDLEAIVAAVDIVKTLVDTMSGKSLQLENTGIALAESFKAGFESKYDEIETVGKDTVQGLINGIQSKKQALKTAVQNVSQAAINQAKTTLDINSPSKEFYKIGAFVIQGLINGVSNNAGDAQNEMTKLGTGLLVAIQTKLGINSPSTVMRDEVGRYIVQGIAEGITKDMSAEEAAAQKASNIVNAFKTALDSISLDMTTVDLEQQLWENLTGAPEGEATQKQLETTRKKLELQAEKVAYAQAEYQATAKALGETAEQTQEVYNKFLREKITLSELSKTFYEMQNSMVVSQKDAIQSYNDIMKNEQKVFEMMGWTTEEARKYAAEQSGLDPDTLTAKAKSEFASVQEIFDYYMKDVEVIIKEGVASGVSKASQTASSGGQQIGQNIASGMAQGVSSNSNAVVDAAQSAIDQIQNQVSGTDFSGSATNLVEGLIDSLNDKINSAGSAGSNFFESIRNGFNKAAGINSPSKEMYQAGTYLVMGLANGIKDNAYMATDALASLLQFGDEAETGTPMPIFMQMLLGGFQGQQENLIAFISQLLDDVFLSATSDKQEAYYQNGYKLSEALAKGVLDGFKTTYQMVFEEVQMMLDELETEVLRRAASIQTKLQSIQPVVNLGSGSSYRNNGGSSKRTPIIFPPTTSSQLASGIAYAMDSKPSQDIRNTNSVTNNYAFTQNNYSPSALSRSDIYRDTKNQFSAFKEAVEAK